MAGIVHIPWYATIFRADRFALALADIAPVAVRYGALDYEVRRSREDPYKFFQTATFEGHADFYAYWEGPEFIDFRARYTSWFQVPVVADWYDRVTHGQLQSGHEAHSHTEGAPAVGDIA